MLLRAALLIAERLATLLPGRVAYAAADLAGDLWRRLSPTRRALVAANLARVCTASGRPTSGRAFSRLVRDAFRNHARYYLELLRAPRYTVERIAAIVEVPQWEPELRAALSEGPAIVVSWHLGSFEPFGTFLAARGLRPLAPIEEIQPRELFEFLTARRARGAVDIVPVSGSRPALSRRLREGGVLGIIGDRDLVGGGQRVTLFGHETTMPLGPATLARAHGATVVAGRCLRTGPDRFRAEGAVIRVPTTADRHADIASLVAALAARLQTDIAEAPEQWWGAFQPVWPDLAAGSRSDGQTRQSEDAGSRAR